MYESIERVLKASDLRIEINDRFDALYSDAIESYPYISGSIIVVMGNNEEAHKFGNSMGRTHHYNVIVEIVRDIMEAFDLEKINSLKVLQVFYEPEDKIMKELTKLGVKNLMERIEQHMIVLPKEPMAAKELEAWINGYSQCERAILRLISEMMEEQNG